MWNQTLFILRLIAIFAARFNRLRSLILEYIKWMAKYELGVNKIDSQHKHLIGILNEFLMAQKENKSSSVLKDILEKVIDYTKYHFITEETHMVDHKYPALLEHKAQHKVLIKQIIQILEGLKQNKISAHEELTTILKNWILKHVLNHDMEYGHFLNDK